MTSAPAVPTAPTEATALAAPTTAGTTHHARGLVTRQAAPPTKPAPHRQSALLTWFFRMPIALYRLGLADQLGRSTLLLTTRGRKTGRPRTTALNYLADGGLTYVLSGMGPRSDWLRNLKANPDVHVQIGRRRFAARAELLLDPAEHRRILCLWAEQGLRNLPPPAVQSLFRRIGFDYAASITKHLDEDPPPPIVALRPLPTTGETHSSRPATG